jgi:hypothetical protein
MSTGFAILLAFALFAVLASLALGLVSMVKGGEFNARHGNKLMRARVAFQGLALLLFVIGMLMGRH